MPVFDLWTLFALLLIFEGLLPALAPSWTRRALATLLALPNGTIRWLGLSAMLLGLLLLIAL